MFLWLLIIAACGNVVNEVIEGEIGIEQLIPSLTFTVDFTSTEPINQYVFYLPLNESNSIGFMNCFITSSLLSQSASLPIHLFANS